MPAKKKTRRSPTITINPKHCKISPPGPVRAPAKKNRGFVNFNATAACTILFTNPKVFGRPFIKLARGPNKRFTKIDRGRTFVMITGCEYLIPKSLGARSNPTEILVP